MPGANTIFDKLLPWSALISSFTFVIVIVVSR